MRKPAATTFFCWICLITLLALCVLPAHAQDWTEWRGPTRDGLSPEKGLPDKWSPNGENLLWRVPFGGRSTPIVFGDHVYVQNTFSKGAAEQERVMCLDANTGKTLWEYKFTIYNSDVPPHRVGWASPAVDPETGNVYVMGVGGLFFALSKDGKKIWERQMTEEFGLITTHGGRTTSPIVEGNMVLMTGPTFGWGTHGPGSTKFFAFDKRTGDAIWVSAPAGRPSDTTYSPLLVTDVDGTRLLITGASDGAVHALKVNTGEPVWNYMMSKRGINTGVLMVGKNVFVSHSEENFDSNEMGFIAAVDAASKGTVPLAQVKYRVLGVQVGFSSPVTDGKVVYQIDNGALLLAFDAASGQKLWEYKLGTIQKASPLFADGKLYVGTETGKFFILRPKAGGVDVLSENQLGPEADPEQVLSSASVSRGRVFFATSAAVYAIGKKAGPYKPSTVTAMKLNPTGTPAYLQVSPTDFIAKPGEKVQFHLRAFDDKGQLIREEKQATWNTGNLAGSVSAANVWTVPSDGKVAAGDITATVGTLSGTARVRVVPPLPWTVDAAAMPLNAPPVGWINAATKYAVKETDGKKYLTKIAQIQHTFYLRARTFMGPSDLSDYTIEADVRSPIRRRQQGDIGVVAQGFTLVLFGSHQKLDIQSWQPEVERIVSLPYEWKPDTWYHLKLRVENLPDGSVRAMGKAWPSDAPEPAKWMVEKVDPIGAHTGSPGLFGSAPFEMLFDNVKVYANSASN